MFSSIYFHLKSFKQMNNYLFLFILILPALAVSSEVPEGVRSLKSNAAIDHDLSNIVKHHKEAYTIWNITTKHKLLNKYNMEECTGAVRTNHKLIGPLLVNITLRDSEEFLREFLMKEHYNIKGAGSELSHASHILSNVFRILEDEEIYYHAVQKILSELGYDRLFVSICPAHSYCGCVWTKYVEEYEQELTTLKQDTYNLHEYVIYGLYIDPAVTVPIFIIGFALNVVLVIIYSREKGMRTESNLLLFSLCINNILILMIYTPLQYMNVYYRLGKYYLHDLIIIEVLVTSVNAMTVMCLNVKRYYDVSRILKPDIQGCRMSTTLRCIVYVSIIWVWSGAIAAFCGFENERHVGVQESVVFVFLYLFVLSIAIAVFSSLSAKKLQRAAEQGQTSIEFQHITGSGVILALTIVFYVVYTPFFILLLYSNTAPDPHDNYFMGSLQRAVHFIIYKLLISYPCIVLLILYRTCKAHRFYFRKYICRWWYIPDDGEYITMSSLQNAENQEQY